MKGILGLSKFHSYLLSISRRHTAFQQQYVSVYYNVEVHSHGLKNFWLGVVKHEEPEEVISRSFNHKDVS